MIAPEYETITFRLRWKVTCKLACQALIHKLDFERLCELAIKKYLSKDK